MLRESGPCGQSKNIVVDKPQPEAGFIGFGVKEFLFKVAYEQVSIGGGHKGAHGRAFDLEAMMVVEGEVVVVNFDTVSLQKHNKAVWRKCVCVTDA